MKRIIEIVLPLWMLASGILKAQEANEVLWPRELQSSQGLIILYQPQPQELNGNHLTGTAAFSITPAGKANPLFGALYFDAVLDIDRESDLYSVTGVSLPNLKFSSPDSSVNESRLKDEIMAAVPSWNITGSLDELITSISQINNTSDGTEAFRNDPPEIIFSKISSVLILMDGEPRLQPLEGSSVRRVVNTPFLMLKSDADQRYYLYGGESWFVSDSPSGKWEKAIRVPSAVIKVAEQSRESNEQSSSISNDASGQPPQIIVSTRPAELIQTKGEPNFVPVANTSLLYVKNSDDEIFRDITTQRYFILKSGRWYASERLENGWTYVPADKIPADFAKIEPGTEKDVVLASVPGTTESRDAILDARVPQTATVDRKTAGQDISVQYDGAPQFEAIEGTGMQLAVNASKTVMISGGMYYLVDNGVWYESPNYNGPWQVSTTRPADVDKIPPSCPAYNTRYVYIYEYTPDVVYVGYTPGYCGAYIYGPTVVYGTGWYYRPWYGTVYYPRPWTWGFNMYYNPWTGWSIGYGFSSGPWHFGFGGWGYQWSYWGGGWFGPPVYYPPLVRPYSVYGYNRPAYYGPRPGTISRPGNRPSNRPSTRENLYSRPGGNRGVSSGIRNRDAQKNVGAVGRPQTRPAVNPATRPGTAPATRPNNVYTDRDGNVYRRNTQGNWEQHKNNQWNSVQPGGSRLPDLNRDLYNRDRGNNRFNNNPLTRPMPAPSRPSINPRPSIPVTRPATGGHR